MVEYQVKHSKVCCLTGRAKLALDYKLLWSHPIKPKPKTQKNKQTNKKPHEGKELYPKEMQGNIHASKWSVHLGAVLWVLDQVREQS